MTQTNQTFTTKGDAIFIAKDFTTVLSMKRDKRAAILAQLREIHDGKFKRDFGTGVTKVWNGRVTIIAGVTPALDRHYSIFSVLGERFLQLRWHRPDSEEAGEWAIRQQGHESDIQREASAAVKAIFDSASKKPPVLSQPMASRIAALAEVVALGRTHIFRNGYGREIEYVPEPEANTRIAKGLAALTRGIAALMGRDSVSEQDLQDGFRVGLDCIPEDRRRVITSLMKGTSPNELDIAPTVLRRALEELRGLKILQPEDEGLMAPKQPATLTERVEQLLEKANVDLK